MTIRRNLSSLKANVFRMEEIEMAPFESEILTVDGSVARELGTRLISARIISAVVAIALGMTIISVVGFAPNDFIHAAAHDLRHSAGFPCH
ncbi:MAG: CbtB domain-containing protein [Candidatus Binataceae bacterium]